MKRVLSWLLSTGLIIGCVSEEPVLTGIPQTPLLTEEPGQPAPTPKVPSRYEKSKAVYVDVRYLGGKPYHQVRDVIFEQLGQLITNQPMDDAAGERLEFQRGTIRVINKAVVMMRIPLQQPMRRTEALEALGFPPFVGGYTIFHREYRLHHEWGFRRIRLKREDRKSERVIEVEAWRWLPGERELGR